MRMNPEIELKRELLKVNVPGRYVGGEYGITIKEKPELQIALCFPDLYEIGMSNQALKLIYEMINSETEASCERVFNPAPDFEEILRNKNIPLYSLETGTDIKDFDILAFTIGYELAATNILNILSLSNIAIENSDREADSPVIIAGGPAITNPIPFGSFIDAVFIGEAEDVFKEIVDDIIELKSKGGERKEIIELLNNSKYFWTEQRVDKKLSRAVWAGFTAPLRTRKYVVPSVSTVQDHGVVEIMRGCPNGCRFCHAGIFYRPYREKSIDSILKEVDDLIRNCGYREITLSSLSSGDFSYIKELIMVLNEKYSSQKISFSFPSIRINSFTLPLISEISKVRKSGLTFAVETPDIIHQKGLNKEAPKERIIQILKEAKKLGWNKAKFYFMVGLPFFKDEEESDAIIDFLREVGRQSRMQLNVNIGTFIPKPHTPFQWSFQLDEKTAFDRIIKIKKALPAKFFKVGFQSPFISFIEGIISRGDERAGQLIKEAYYAGAKLDAWEEYLEKDKWRSVIDQALWDVEKEICSETSLDENLPWSKVNINISEKFLKDEYNKSIKGELTSACIAGCDHNCGACNSENKVDINRDKIDFSRYLAGKDDKKESFEKRKILFSYRKYGKAIYLSHINIMNVFERAFLRAGVDVCYSEGFNPKPKLEFANPLTLGFESDDEIAAIDIYTNEFNEKTFISVVNKSLPEGIELTRAKSINFIADRETGKKIKSLMACYAGGEYKIGSYEKEDIVKLTAYLKRIDSTQLISENIENREIIIESRPASDGKILNIYKYLKETCEFEYPFDHFNITRNQSYCLNNNKDSNTEDDYFSCFN